MVSCPVDQNVPVLPILSEGLFLKIIMILRQKVGNLRLISSENFFIHNELFIFDEFFSFNKHPGLLLHKRYYI